MNECSDVTCACGVRRGHVSFVYFQEALQLSWFDGFEDAASLEMKTPSFSRPSLQNMTLLSGHDFRAELEKMSTADDRKHLKVLASLRKVDLKFGPLYYDGCGGSGSSGRICMKRVCGWDLLVLRFTSNCPSYPHVGSRRI